MDHLIYIIKISCVIHKKYIFSIVRFLNDINSDYNLKEIFSSFFPYVSIYNLYDCVIGVSKEIQKNRARSFVTGSDKSRFSQSEEKRRERNKKVSRLCHFYRQPQYPRLLIASRNFSDLSSGRGSPPFRSRGLPHVNHTLCFKHPLYRMRSQIKISWFSSLPQMYW